MEITFSAHVILHARAEVLACWCNWTYCIHKYFSAQMEDLFVTYLLWRLFCKEIC